MASMSGAHSIENDRVRGIVAESKQLTVDRLRRVLKQERLQVSGVKNELQTRLVAHIYDCQRRNDSDSISRIRDAVRGYPSSNPPYSHTPNSYPSPYSNHTPASSASPQYYASPTPRLPPSASLAMPGGGYTQNRVTFKNSPFYSILKPLSNVIELKPREQTRDTAKLTVNLDDALAARLQTDPNCRAMVFCAVESYDSTWKQSEIVFPQHAELKCNQEEVKVNLKGMKNKPGSTRPADITPFLRKKHNFPNSIELVYALTNKKHHLLVNLVQKKPIDTLVQELKSGKYLGKERVIREMQMRAKDDDIVATSSNMSLKDPVQMTRIETPCRSMACKHNECFDGAVFLALQEQAPLWQCPICNKPAHWDNLLYDLFFQDILNNTKSNAQQVTVEPDGTWHSVKSDDDDDDDDSNPFGKHNDSDGDDDLVELIDLEAPSIIGTAKIRPSMDSIRTPPLNAGGFVAPQPPNPASQPSASLARSMDYMQTQPSISRKRPREAVIDLTLSDDDDDEPPVSRIKRPSVSMQISADNDRLSGALSGPLRFNLPPPIPRTDSPGHYYEFDHFNTRL